MDDKLILVNGSHPVVEIKVLRYENTFVHLQGTSSKYIWGYKLRTGGWDVAWVDDGYGVNSHISPSRFSFYWFSSAVFSFTLTKVSQVAIWV